MASVSVLCVAETDAAAEWMGPARMEVLSGPFASAKDVNFEAKTPAYNLIRSHGPQEASSSAFALGVGPATPIPWHLADLDPCPLRCRLTGDIADIA